MGGQSQSASSSTTESSVTNVTDSFNQAFSSTEALSDIGNISISTGGKEGGLSSLLLPLIVIAGIVAVMMVMKKKGS